MKDDKAGSRETVLASTDCPSCGAKAGELCHGIRGKPRWQLHLSRWETWARKNKVDIPWRKVTT
jgi:hypothetical protein